MLQTAIRLLLYHRLLIWPAAGICLGLYTFALGVRTLQRKRLILNTPASKIRSATTGLVEVSGLAIGPHVITSPLKQIDCYYYRTIAWRSEQSGNREWKKVADETLHVPFYLDDSTDKMLIDPTGALMDLHCDLQEQYQASSFESSPMPVYVEAFLVRHGVNSNAKIKVEEYCVKHNDFLFVFGTLSQNPGLDISLTPRWATRSGESSAEPESTESLTSQKIIHLSSGNAPVPAKEMTQQQKIAAALAKSGTFSAAWTSGNLQANRKPARAPRTATAIEERHSPIDATGFDLHPPVVMMKGSEEPTFFISWKSQREVVNSLGWKVAAMIWGSPVLVLVCVYLLVHLSKLG
jgi:hypothetical protein